MRVLAAGLWLVFGATPASAQSAQEQALAREYFQRATQAAERQDWDEAAEYFGRSYELVRRLPPLFNWASSLAQAGRLVEARERYQRYVALGEDEELIQEAQRVIEEIEPRIARLTVLVESLQPSDEVRLDDDPLAAAAIGAPLPSDPGAHVVTVSRGSAELVREGFVLREGESRTLSLTVQTPGDLNGSTPDAGPYLDENNREEDEGGSVLASPWLWLTVGLVLAAGATVATVLLVDSDSGADLPLYEGTADPASVGLP